MYFCQASHLKNFSKIVLFFSRYQAINEKSLNPVQIIFFEVFAIARINLFDVQ